MFGTQMLLEELFKALGIEPEMVKMAFERIQKEIPEAADRFGRMEQGQVAIIQALAATQAIVLRLEPEFMAFRALVTDYILRQRERETEEFGTVSPRGADRPYEDIPASPPAPGYRAVVSEDPRVVSVFQVNKETGQIRLKDQSVQIEHYPGDNAPFVASGAD